MTNNKPTGDQRWCPDVDPITGYPLFMWISHPELGYVPTYGGPYDSYTLAERDENGEFFRRRYDHDYGGWVEDEYVGVIVVEDWLPKNQAELDEYVRDNPPAELQERRSASGLHFPDPASLAAAISAVKCYDELSAELIAEQMFMQSGAELRPVAVPDDDKTNMLCDSAYVNGLQAGFSMGQMNQEAEYAQTVEHYRKGIREYRAAHQL